MSTVLALMLEQAPAWGETETTAERNARLETIAAAASIEAANAPPGWRWSTLALTATLLATTYEEGRRWSVALHNGSNTGDGGRARCLAQLHQHPTWVPGPMWRASAGLDLDATQLCMRGAARILAHYSATCVTDAGAKSFERSVARVIAGYGTGRSCVVQGRPWASRRARLAARWLRELEAA